MGDYTPSLLFEIKSFLINSDPNDGNIKKGKTFKTVYIYTFANIEKSGIHYNCTRNSHKIHLCMYTVTVNLVDIVSNNQKSDNKNWQSIIKKSKIEHIDYN